VVTPGKHNINNSLSGAGSRPNPSEHQATDTQLRNFTISQPSIAEDDKDHETLASTQSRVSSQPSSQISPPQTIPQPVSAQAAMRQESNLPPADSFFTRGIATVRTLGTSIGSSLCYSLTGVCNQAARGATTDVALYPNPFLYSGLRSAVATVVSYLKDQKTLREDGLKTSFQKMGPEGRTMCVLMGLNNVLWVPTFMLTDLASAIVIACSQPFVHAIYERVTTGRSHSRIETASLALSAAALVSVAVSAVTASSAYPYAIWGNLCGVAAVLCFCAYMIINNNVVQRTAQKAGPDAESQQSAKKAAQEQLRAVPFFSQLTSTAMGFGLFLPLHSGALLSGGLGLSVANTLTMAVLHGMFTAAALHLRTAATQTNKPLLVSLISNFQVGLTPALGFLLLGSTIPQFAIVAGALSFASSFIAFAGEYLKQKPQRASAY
jgi:drug/metabolite transporter (DMT)-like permease